MFRSILFGGAMLAAGALSAQEVAISGKDFLSGAGDAKIAELARQAAATGKTLVITAPPYWQDKAVAKAHAGAANANLRTSDAFFENVMVRVEDTKPAARAETPAKTARAEPRPEPKPAPRPAPPPKEVVQAPPPRPAPAPVARPEPPPVAAAPAARPKPVPAAPAAAVPAVAAAPAAPMPVQKPAPAPAAPATPPPADRAVAIRQHMQQNLNNGDPAEGTMQVAQLQKDDLLFVDGPVRAVVRRFGPRTHLYWLEGDLNLERAELLPTGNDRYRVTEPIRNVANPTLRGSSKGSLKFVAKVPAPKSPARTAIERQYNDGRNIDGTLTPVDLRQGDLVYTGEGSAVVVRRTSVGIERDWLVGELDLRQTGLQTQGNAIRVLTDTIK